MDRARVDEVWERYRMGEPLALADERELLGALRRDPALRADLLEDERLDGTLAMLGRDEEAFLRAFDERLRLEADADRFAAKVAPRLTTRRAVARPTNPPLVAAAVLLALGIAALLFWPSSDAPPAQVWKPAPRPDPKVEAPAPRKEVPPAPAVRPKEEPLIDRARIEDELKSAIPPKAEPAPKEEKPAPPVAPTIVKKPEPVPETTKPVIARLERAEGVSDLLAGQGVEGRAAIVFPDKTRVELGPDTTLREVGIDGGKKLALERGSLRAEVTKQPKDQPLIVQTPHGEAKVVGTILSLVVDPDPRKGTRLEVEEGKVEFRSGAKKISVDAGQVAVAAVGVPLASRRPATAFDIDLNRPQPLRSRLEFGAVVQTPEGPLLRSTPNKSKLWSSEIAYWAGSEDIVTFTLKKGSVLRFRYFLKAPSEVNFRIKNLSKREYFVLDFPGVVGRWVTVSVPVLDVPVITDGLKVSAEPGDKYGRWSILVGTPEQPADLDLSDFRILELDR